MGMNLNMDYSNIEPNAGGSSYLPVSDSKGWLVVMTDSMGKENSAKTGTILECKLVGQEPPVQGKEHTLRINITNPNQKAVEIGIGECSAIAHATGHIRVGNSQEWHGKPFRVVVVSDASEQYPNATRVQRIHNVNGELPKLPGQGAMQAGQQVGNFGGNAGQGQPASGGAQQGFGNGQQQGQFVQQGQPQFQQGQPNNAGPQGGQPNPGQQFNPQGQQGGYQQGQFNPQGQQHQQPNGGGFDPNTGQPLNNGQQQFQQGQQGAPGWANG